MNRGVIAVLVLLLCAPFALAATSAEPVLVRVTNYTESTRTYTFSCVAPAGTSEQRYWTVRPDTNEVELGLSTTAATLTYNLTQNVMYHVGCQVQNLTSGQAIRGDFHIDRRTGPNTNKPDVRAVAVINTSTVTYQCTPPANVTHYNLYWTFLSIQGSQSFPALNNRNTVNLTTPNPLLWDVDCGVWDIDRNQWMQWGYPVEYFPDSVPYFPTINGCVPGEPCPWANGTGGGNTTTNQTNTTTNQTGNGTGQPVNVTICYESVLTIPAACTGGIITSDTNTSGRAITCAQGGNSVSLSGWDKSNSTASWFELYRQGASGLPPKICLGATCIQNGGFAKSPQFPVCINVTINQTNTTANQTNTTTNQTGNGTNLPPLAPGWYEPSGQFNVSPYDFHIHITPMSDPENDTHAATDFELWDVTANQRVWSRLNSTVILVHIHNADGTFEGNLAGQSHLLPDHDYRLRARVYARTANNTIQTSPWSVWRAFHTRAIINSSDSPFLWTARPGYTVELVAANISVPVNVVRAPDGLYQNLPQGRRPLLYVTQLYGQVGVIRRDGSYGVFAGNLLNYAVFGSLPGSGETGVDGLYVDPTTGALYVSLVEANASALNGFQGKVMRFTPNASGDGYVSSTTLLNHITVVPSHHVHTITRGPDGKLYLSTGDAFQEFHTRDPAWTNGKILRFNEDGSVPADNPVPGSYFWAGGFRNPFGAAWRPGTQELWVTNNGEDSNDGVYAVHRGDLYGWCAITCDTLNGTIWNWSQTVSPTAGIFNTVSDGVFPNDTAGNYYVALSGETYTPGMDLDGKRIVEFYLEPNGDIRSVEPLVTYTGDGYSAPIGLAFGPEGLYFTDIYGELGFVGVGTTRGNVYLVKPGAQTAPNGTNTTSGLVVGLGPAPWFPQGLNMIWKCAVQGGSAPYTYLFTFGDGQQSPSGYTQDNIWHTYGANGTYNATCTVTDALGVTGMAATTLVLGAPVPPPGDTAPPVLSQLLPTGQLAAGTTSATLRVTTDEIAACRYSATSGIAFASMNPFAATDSTTHTSVISGLANGSAYAYYVKCRDTAGNTNPSDAIITFSVANATSPPPTVSATLAHAPWFPQGRNTVLVCNATGFAPTAYDFTFGDGQTQPGYGQNNVWHTYAAAGSYPASCVARNGATSAVGTLQVILS